MKNKDVILEKFQIRNADELVEQLQRNITMYRNLLETLPEIPMPSSVGGSWGGMWITYPYNRELREKITQIFLDAGWEKNWEITESEIGEVNGEPRIRFIHSKTRGADVVVEFSTFKEGSTCTRKRVGTVTKEVPVFDYSCGEDEDDS